MLNVLYILLWIKWKPGVGFMVRVAGLGSLDPAFKPLLTVELTPGEVESACHSSEVGEMSTSVLVIGALHRRHSHTLRQCCYPQPCAAYE